jgi:prepilin-type N-terminal cleavage/methylation domain-containing protein
MKIQKAEIRGRQSAVSQNSLFRFRLAGFTLVELLVVITIIALLAGLLLPVIIGAIGKAEKAKAQGEVNAIATAIEQYQIEYSKFPNQTGTSSGDHQYGASEYINLIAALRGSNFMWGGSSYANTRGHVFLSVDEKSIVASNASGTAAVGMLSDPWGNRYEIIADWNFDNRIDNPMADGSRVAGRGVAVWSRGPKGIVTAGDPSHIRSWK